MADFKLYYSVDRSPARAPVYRAGTRDFRIIELTNDPDSYPKASDYEWREWTPTSYLDDEYYNDVSKLIYKIDGDYLGLPEDSTGIFRKLGVHDGSNPIVDNGDPNKVRADLHNIKTDYVKNLSYAFYGAQVTEIKGLEEGYMVNVEDISYMFAKMTNGVPFFNGGGTGDIDKGKLNWAGNVDNCFAKYGNYGGYQYIHTISDTAHGVMPNLKTMEGLFDGSYNINRDLLTQMKTGQIGNQCSNFSRAFALAGQKPYVGTQYELQDKRIYIDLSKGATATSNVNCKQMFYNYNNYGTISLPKTFSNPQIFSDVDYMFFNNLNISNIYVDGDTDGAENQTILDSTNGYQMFYNCKSIKTFDSTKTNIFKANTTNGYFNSINVYDLADAYIRLPSGWRVSTPYIKTETGWKESEVYW